jgi:hypothetical protein
MIDLSFRRSKGVLAIVAYVTLSSILGLGSSGFACGGGAPTSPPPPPPPGAGPMSGSWSGNGNVLINGVNVAFTINAVLSQDQFGVVTGSGNIISQFLNCAHTTQGSAGTAPGQTFGLIFNCVGVAQIVNYAGTISANFNSLIGALNGSGFTATALTMQRQ